MGPVSSIIWTKWLWSTLTGDVDSIIYADECGPIKIRLLILIPMEYNFASAFWINFWNLIFIDPKLTRIGYRSNMSWVHGGMFALQCNSFSCKKLESTGTSYGICLVKVNWQKRKTHRLELRWLAPICDLWPQHYGPMRETHSVNSTKMIAFLAE